MAPSTAMDVKLTAAVADASQNVSRFCIDQGISRSTFYKWRDRYRMEGLAGLEERSSRPTTWGPRMAADVEDRIVGLRKTLTENGLDAGAATIWGHLVDEGWDPVPSEASIWRALTRRGFIPGMVLSDNDLVYSGARRNMTVSFEANLMMLGVRPITSSPYHPQTCGKVERYHQTEQKWLRAHPAATLEELNQLLATFNDYYNQERKHRSLGKATPAHVHQTDPKAGAADRPLTNRKRVSTGRVAVDGTVWSRPWRIAVGKAHAGTPVTTIIDGDQAYIFTGDTLLRHLTLDPTRQHQPLGCPR